MPLIHDLWTQSIYGIRIYNAKHESILAFISLTRWKLRPTPGRRTDEALTASSMKRIRLSFIIPTVVVVCQTLHLSEISAGLVKLVSNTWCSARRALLDLGSSRACSGSRRACFCDSWPDITADETREGRFCHLTPVNTDGLESVEPR